MEGSGGSGVFSEDDGFAHRSRDCRLLKKKLFASWDQFVMPYPRARALFKWGSPIWVERNASQESLEAKRIELEQVLTQMTVEAEAAVVEKL